VIDLALIDVPSNSLGYLSMQITINRRLVVIERVAGDAGRSAHRPATARTPRSH